MMIIVLTLTKDQAWANSVVEIDLRDGVTEAKISEYRQAVLGGSQGNTSPKLIKLLIDADKGFDAGWLQVPKTRRNLRVNVVIYTFRGHTITAPIRLNLFELDSRSIKHINLEVSLR